MSVSTTGLEGSFSRMQLQQPAKPAPSNAQKATVHVLTPAEQRELNAQVGRIIEIKRTIADIDVKIAQAQANQVEAKKEIATGKALEEKGRALQAQGSALQAQGSALKTQGKALQEQAKAQTEQTKANQAQHTAQAVKGLETMASALFKMKDVYEANPAALVKIETLRTQILQFKDNLPQDPTAIQTRVQELKQAGLALQQSLKKG